MKYCVSYVIRSISMTTEQTYFIQVFTYFIQVLKIWLTLIWRTMIPWGATLFCFSIVLMHLIAIWKKDDEFLDQFWLIEREEKEDE